MALTRVKGMKFVRFADWLMALRDAGLMAHARERTWSKGQTIFSQGEAYADVVTLTTGLVKLHYTTHDGKEWIKSFVADEGIFASRTSLALDQPSAFSALCLEDSRTLHVPYTLLGKAIAENGALARVVQDFSQWLGLRKEEREHDLLCLSAEDRYRKFMDQETDLARRITQVDMARYLGITPVALSRIKGRLATTK